MIRYIIGIGTSHPCGAQYIERAWEALGQIPHIERLSRSKLYPNAAFGGVTSLTFTNAAFKIQTLLPPDALWFLMHSIELQLGRIRIGKNGPRTLDLDILQSSLGSYKSAYLTLPHPEFRKRPFAFKPASDIGLV